MYKWIWDHLPGPWYSKICLTLLICIAAMLCCFEFIFPMIASWLQLDAATI